ncbi:MAG TPA: hypothetical protein VML50_03870 [Anaeromyxobacter sp.]|nr:hypothetical protein [Anaeromyxobacter sp.]
MSATRAWATLALLLSAGSAAAGEAPALRPSPPPPAARLPPPGAERVVLHVRFPAWQYTGKFRLEGRDGRVDEGVARDVGGYGTTGGDDVERTLEGARGTIRIRLKGGVQHAAGLPVFFGRWSIVSGTGAYAGLAGQGTFLSTTSGDSDHGSTNEVQSLIGYVEGPPAHRVVAPRAN